MAFWGIEVEPAKAFVHRFDKARGRLHISRATLGIGSLTAMSVVQCNVGDNKSPIFLCEFSPMMKRSCPLDLEFEEEDDVVFSVLGPLSVHLTGYYFGNGCCGNVVTNQKKVDGGDQNKVDGGETYTIIQDAEAEKSIDIADVTDGDHSEVNKMNEKSKAEESEEKKELIVETKDKKAEVKPCQIRTLANGLVIEELEMGKTNSTIATFRTEVSVHFIGKLQSNGLIFEANVGTTPMVFTPGDGKVIKGLEIGINGMRIGGKRRLTVPPSLGYKSGGFNGVPPDAWLEFDVEVVNIC